LALTSVVALISACSDSNTSSTLIPNTGTYAEMEENFQRLELADQDRQDTAAQDMPTSGKASYRGNAEFDNAMYLAAIDMDATFDAAGGQVSGRIHNVQHQDGTARPGELEILQASFTH